MSRLAETALRLDHSKGDLSLRALLYHAQGLSFREFIELFDEKKIALSTKGDFLIDDTYIVEVGGKSKKYNQIKDVPNSFVVSDDIEIGSGNKIPLWLFGFLY